MKKSILIIIPFLIIGCTTQTTFEFPELSQRERISFDDEWTFHLGHAANPAKDFNFGTDLIFAKSSRANTSAINPKFNDSTWTTVNLPHDWADELPFAYRDDFNLMVHGYKAIGGLFPKNSVGWYRKRFEIAAEDSTRNVSITFDGVFRDAKFWLNGFYLGTNESGYIGVTYELNDYLNYGGDNVLVVRVDATQFEGWFYEGAGIYRHVWLNKYAKDNLVEDGLFLYTELGNNSANVFIEAEIETDNSDGLELQTFITNRSGTVLTKASTPINGNLDINGKLTGVFDMRLDDPRLWELDDPYLYRAIAVLKRDGKPVDHETVKFGVRSIEMTPQEGLFLNGKQVKLKGVNCHQDHAGVGSALPDYLQYWRIQQLKNMGTNAYRTSHNPPTPELLEACDSLGMLVMDETRMMNTSPEYMDQWTRMIRRDRNHPSVYMWSIGNEEQNIQTTSHGKRIAISMMELLDKLDPTRTSTYAADLANVRKGINEVIPVRGFNYRVEGLKPYHQDHPDQPIVGTEMGSTVTTRGIYVKDSVIGYLPDQDLTHPWWASLAEDWWPVAAENDWMMGGFIWSGFDYRGEPTPFQWPNINSHFGVMDVCGFPKNLYYYYQSWWRDEDVLHISPHWNWPGKEAQPIQVWVNSNAEKVELFLNGNSLGTKAMPRNGHLNWLVPYIPGNIEAVATRDGREFRRMVETTGKAVEIVVLESKTTMFADGKDVVVMNIRAVDAQGRDVPDAQNLIKFSITGGAKIIGVGNGNPSSHEPDKCQEGQWQRRLFNGKCQVIVQAGKTAGKFSLMAESEGLWPGGSGAHMIDPVVMPSNEQEIIMPHPDFKFEKILGADISWLPELEARGRKFYDNGLEQDALEIFKNHGFNYIRLRIFNNPENEKGYSPEKGFCDLEHTLQMAKRVKEAGMGILLDFHYSDTWADPGKQFKPKSWQGLEFDELNTALHNFTVEVLTAMKDQGTPPDFVQVGNEINHGILWPEGHIGNPQQLAALLKSGLSAVAEVLPDIPVMLHLALGGQMDETIFWMDQMLAYGCEFDVLGLSSYHKWHGTPEDWRNNIRVLVNRYPHKLCMVEYSAFKHAIHEMAFAEFPDRIIGTFIWEPITWMNKVFDNEGNTNAEMGIYDEISRSY